MVIIFNARVSIFTQTNNRLHVEIPAGCKKDVVVGKNYKVILEEVD